MDGPLNIILIPGLWLDGSSWERVVPVIENAGHAAHPITTPGMEGQDAQRSSVRLSDCVAAAVAAIDAADGPALLVGQSAGAGIAHAAVDARPDRMARVMYIGGFPYQTATRSRGASKPHREVWRPAIETAGFSGLKIHDLRHTAASLMFGAGASIEAVRSQLGHRSADITPRIYSHLLDDHADDVADALNSVYTKSKSSRPGNLQLLNDAGV